MKWVWHWTYACGCEGGARGLDAGDRAQIGDYHKCPDHGETEVVECWGRGQ